MKLGIPKADEDGVRRVRLGVVEFAAVVLAITVGWWLIWQLVSSQVQAFVDNQKEANTHITALTTQVTVLNDQVSTLTTQLANVPALTGQLAQIRAEVDDHERRIQRLEDQRGVKVKMDALNSFLAWLGDLFRLPAPAQPEQAQPALPPAKPADPIEGFSDATVLARTAWAEARSQGSEGMQAVCNVIQNRAATPGWWGSTLRDVCLDHATEKNGRVVYQFSCWDPGDPQAARIRADSIDDASYPIADSLALRAVTARLPDITHGADHYYAEYIPTPKWAIGKTPTFVCGKPGSRHFFFHLGLAG